MVNTNICLTIMVAALHFGLWGLCARAHGSSEEDFSVIERERLIPKKDKFYYYDSQPVGAQAFYTPWNFIMEGGYGALYGWRLDTFDFSSGAKVVGRSLLDPITTVEHYGYGRFFWHEFIPHFGEGMSWTPNWNWHLIGGGFRTRLLKEYYLHQGSEYPTANAWASTYLMHYFNEIIQAAKYPKEYGTVDAIADLVFFDFFGKLLFEIDAVNEFFAKTLHLREWSFQTRWDPQTKRLDNHGQLYWVRYEVYDPLSIGILTGEQASTVNITWRVDHKHQWTFGIGTKPKDILLTAGGVAKPSSIVFDFGFFYSVNDNPLVVFTYEPADTPVYHTVLWDSVIRLNFYPGTLGLDSLEESASLALTWDQGTFYAHCVVGWSMIGVDVNEAAVHGDFAHF
ncbi:MAG: hypothetical protein VYA34_08965 [Myxococcota bacterium]|nr:hypothetical protein [Myxococcota bacterium]